MSADHPAPDGPVAIGVDIGGTKVGAGVVDVATGAVLHHVRRDTPDRTTSPRVVEDVIVDAVGAARTWARDSGLDPRGVGVGAAGFVAADRARVVFAPHLSWRDEPLRDRLTQRLRLPVVVDNDANAAAWAEYRFGAGVGEERVVMVTLGTGIGGGILTRGVIDRGRHGLAGEFGHMLVVPDGHRCECGNRGCWEQYSSGRALRREAIELLAQGGPYAAGLATICEGDPTRLDGQLVSRAAQGGDRAAIDLLSDIGRWLGIGLANLAAALDPGRFVIGGGVSQAGELLLAPARAAFARQLTGRGHRPVTTIVPAALGPEAGLIGAAALAVEEIRDADPAPGT